MRLEKIILNGFKSFADKTEFPFDTAVTAIVGPNGCGKSNVVDAVKWVLGEQKVKSLRSDQMTDVIFSGSGSRKAAGSAEVSLVLANPEAGGGRRLLIDSDQVQITRKVYRSGDSEYRINGKICRLKDIRGLLMDTGLGTKAYSIIEQGQIDQILGASTAERRLVFEEAAGISKFKAQKNEAARKLDRTEQNLLRLADILEEVGKRLRSVKLQAGKARNYLQYSERLKDLQLNYSLVEYGKYRDLLHVKNERLEISGVSFGELAAEVARADTTVSQLGNTIIEKEHELGEVGNRLVSAQSRIEQNLQRIEFLRRRGQEMSERGESQRQQIEHLQQQVRAHTLEIKRYQDELDSSEDRLAEKSRVIESVQESVHELNAAVAVLEAELEDEKSGILDIVRRTAQLHNEIRSLSDYRGNLHSQKDRLSSRAQIARAELEEMLTDKAHHASRLQDIEQVLTELQENLESKQTTIQELDAAIAEDNQHLASSKEVRSALRGELAVLEDMECRYEGLTNAVKTLLRTQSQSDGKLDYLEGILAEKIETDFEYATAVEAALEGLTDAIVVNDRQRLLADQATLETLDGRICFVCRDEVAPRAENPVDVTGMPGVKGRLVDRVRFEEHYSALMWKLLGKTLIVDDLETARTLAHTLEGGYQFVTISGELLTVDGHLRMGSLGKATGLISRKSRMRQLSDAIGNANAEINSLEAKITKHGQTRDHQSKLCKDLRTSIYEASTEKMQVTSKLTILEQNIQRLRDEEPLIGGEIDGLEKQIQESVQKEYTSKQQLDELEVVNNERSDRIDDLESRQERLLEQRQQQMAELTELKIELGQLTEQRKSAKQLMVNLEEQGRSARRGVEQAEQEIRNCESQVAQSQRDILASEAAVSELFVEKEQAQATNRALREEIDGLVIRQKETELAMRDKRHQKTDVEQTINDLRVELGQLEVKLQDLIERVQDELQIDLAEAFESHTQESHVDWQIVKVEITELRQKIERLGNVNLDAIEEQETLEERHTFLTTQVEDLDQSKQQLQQLILKLNKTSREKFLVTFEEIRANFQQIFRKLFGGGRADIILEAADDVLEAGIEVMAKPPGKETRSISLLSGGEKSMTALALLFSVFRTKPSPFCFLDEVDAALDEANNERFNLLIKEFEAETQFVIITHAKRTMSIAEKLFGVTMQTQGVSKKISVKFDDYDHDSEAA